MATRAPKPEPIVVTTICSLCDQPWEDHGDEPTTADCIRLLKQQLALRPTSLVVYRDRWNPSFPPIADPQPWIYQTSPNTTLPQITYSIESSDEFGRQIMSTYDSSQLSAGTLTDNVFEFRKPDDGDDGCAPVPAVT